MSRRGKNNVMRSIVQDASSIFSTEQPAARTPTNNFNPLFHYLQTMFPNYDNAVLNSVLEQEGNSIERAVEVLLTFAVPEEPKINNEKEPAEITFDDDNFSDTETLSNVFAVPVMPPVTSHNSGRDHVSLYEQTRKKRKPTKSQRARRRQRAQAAAAAAAAAAKSKKVKWVPLQEFIVESSNPFEALPLESEPEPEPEPESEPLLLSPNLVEQPELLDAFAGDDEQNDVQVSKVLTEEELKWDDFDTSDSSSSDSSSDSEWHPEEPWVEEEPANKCDSDSDSCCDSDWVNEDEPVVEEPVASSPSEDEGFVVIEEPQALPTPEEALPATIPVVEDEMSQQVVVVKLYYSASDIHRLGLTRSTLTFAKLYDYAAAYLQSKAEQSKKADLPLAFALTYVDDENDVIHLCSEEELAEALRLHDDVFWTDGKQPLLRVHIKSLGVAASNDGHIIV